MIATMLVWALAAGAEPQPAAVQPAAAQPAAAQPAPAQPAAQAAPAQPAAAQPAPAAPSPAEQQALVEGKIPDDPARQILQARCLMCHTSEYVTMQRLTEGQWQATLQKMKRWGSPITDDEVKQLGAWLGHTWVPGLPDRRSPRRPAPAGSVPGK